jgi:outer membrane protein TolC
MNMKTVHKRNLLIAAIVLLTLNQSQMSAQRSLTIDDCRRMALESSKSAAIASLTEQKTNYESKAYFSNFLPRFSATGMYLLTNSTMNSRIDEAYLPTVVPDLTTGNLQPNVVSLPDGSPLMRDGSTVFREYAWFPGMDINLSMNHTWLAGIQAEQPIFAGGKILAAWRMSQTGKEIARLNVALTRAEVIVQADEAFYQHLKAIESKKAAVAFQNAVEELLSNVNAAVEAGMKLRNDALKVQVQYNRAKLLNRRADNAIRLSRMNLCRLTGLPPETELTITENEQTSPALLSPSIDISARPEYSILEKQIELKNRQINLVRSDFLPSAGIVANYGYLNGFELNGAPIFKQSSFSALFTLKIPVFHWGEGLNKTRAAKAERNAMQMQRDDLTEKMQLEARQALDRVEESRLEIEMTEKALEQAAENMDTSRRQYEKGMETLAGYLEAQTLWQQAWLENIEANINLRLNETYYKKATGTLEF